MPANRKWDLIHCSKG